MTARVPVSPNDPAAEACRTAWKRLGQWEKPLLRDPAQFQQADYVVLESTYGDKQHQGRTERQKTLEAILRKTLDDKGVTIVPAFSLGRTQEFQRAPADTGGASVG